MSIFGRRADVQLLATDPSHKLLTLQVVFKGSDKVSVKFEFNVEKDTAEEVVAEMIEEQVLPERYQHWITGELNRRLRDINQEANGDAVNTRAVWRRDNDPLSELEKIRGELQSMTDRVRDSDRRRELLEKQALQAEERLREAEQELERYTKRDTHDMDTSEDDGSSPSSEPLMMTNVMTEYTDDSPIDDFVRETAAATNRGQDKAEEWAAKLKDQDIMTVGDLRGLLDEDWSGIGLTVFALRALKNMLRNNGKSPTEE